VEFQVLKLIHILRLLKAVAIVKEQNRLHTCSRWWISIDGVKFISGAVNYNGDQSRFCKKRILIKENALPFELLTLPATGSEMNSGTVAY
jgi:NADP-dependent alcohol dehydrogenase